MKEAKLCQ